MPFAQKQARAAFGGNEEDMPEFNANGLTAVPDIMVAAGIAKSKGEARRLIEGGGVSIGDKKLTINDLTLDEETLKQGSFVLHKGKKVHVKILL